MNAPTENNRLDYLDAVRAFALLLGIVFHASLSFLPIFIGWAVMDISTSSRVTIFMMISHSFRMELFFLIAGFFSHMAFHRKGTAAFLKSRLSRIAGPFLIGWLILYPLIIASWIMGGESMQGEVNILSGLKLGFQTLGNAPTGWFTGSHLWFLYYLLLVTAITLSVRFILTRNAKLHYATTNILDRSVAWLSRSKVALIVLSVPTATCLWHMNHWGMDTPDRSLAPHFPVLAVYGGFFLLGWILHRQKPLLAQFSKLSVGRFVLCVAATFATIKFSEYQSDAGHPQYALIKGSFAFTYAVMMWTLVTLTIGLFKRYLDKPSKIVRYVADASYWLYLIHLPIVIWLQIAFAELSLHWSIKLFSISAITIGFSLVLYDLFVRSTFLGKVLNGRKRNRVLFSFLDRSAPDSSTLPIPQPKTISNT